MTLVPDFRSEAEQVALNEACDPTDPASKDCRAGALCPFCAALAKVIEARFVRVFIAGQASVSEAAKLETPHRS
jgi:hypothetical protein